MTSTQDEILQQILVSAEHKLLMQQYKKLECI